MSESRFGLRRLGQVMVPVRDLSRARDFYRDALGIPFLFEVPRMAFFDLAGVRLMLGEHEQEAEPSGSILYYEVEDIEGAHRDLLERGVEFEQPPTLIAEMPDHDLWMAFLRDSEGNVLALMSEVPRS